MARKVLSEGWRMFQTAVCESMWSMPTRRLQTVSPHELVFKRNFACGGPEDQDKLSQTIVTPPTKKEEPRESDILKKYRESLHLPETRFPKFIPAEKRKDHDEEMLKKPQFTDLYKNQRAWKKDRSEFVLHDGPPYANGEAHIGHAVNKVLKDTTNRYQLLRGKRIHYVPGWDCHGLPIELKTVRESKRSISQNPVEIRNSARKVAEKYISSQMGSFRRWGVMADWEKSYRTFDMKYVKEELNLFHQLFDKNLIYRDNKPIHWSPSSQTALAEAELEYNPTHESRAITLAIDLGATLEELASRLKFSLTGKSSASAPKAQVNAAVWTTTPWTLPANKAIAYNDKQTYAVIFRESSDPNDRQYYIVASSLLPNMNVSTGASFRILAEFPGHMLEGLSYRHPWFEEIRCPFLFGDFVTMDKGTGLVHVAPAHGQDDYLLSLKHKLDLVCYVNNDGKFDSTLHGLSGLFALTEGNLAIIEKLKEKILSNEKFIHPYPYDWRTKKPVIVKTSQQWFINTTALKDVAKDHLENVKIFPSTAGSAMLNQVMSRPYWCISRQRVWGVPIPVLYNLETLKPVMGSCLIKELCRLIDEKGNFDFWWDTPLAEMFPKLENPEKYEKGKDILDIWFDSGVSWHTLEGRTADLYLEGQDQFTGWFQSSLLTSAALRTEAPYHNIFVHGFVVDRHNKKMSKSVGNVVNPFDITDGDAAGKKRAYGADVMRYWIATKGCSGGNVVFSSSLLDQAEQSVQKLRSTLYFLLGSVDEIIAEELELDDVMYEEMEYMDQFMLGLLLKFQKDVTKSYNNFQYDQVMNRTIQFVTTEVSALYFNWIKHRVYYELEDSQSRKSALFVMNELFLTLIKTIAPILPFLAEESYSYYTAVPESLFKFDWFNSTEAWENEKNDVVFALVLCIRESLNQLIGKNDPATLWVEIISDRHNFRLLQILHPDTINSELCDILGVSGVEISWTDQPIFKHSPFGVSHSQQGYSIGISKSTFQMCARCRRYTWEPSYGTCTCLRCKSILRALDLKAKNVQLKQQEDERAKLAFEEPPSKFNKSRK